MQDTQEPNYLPLFADLRERACLVIGGGSVAERKIEPLIAAGARVTVISPTLTPALERRRRAGAFEHIEAPFAKQSLEPYWLIVAATDERDTNRDVYRAAEAAKRYCNVVDDPELCSAIMPAVVERGPVTIAISSGGRSPTLTRWLKALIETTVPARIGELAELLSGARDKVRAALPGAAGRRRFWARLLEGPVGARALAGNRVEAAALLAAAIETAQRSQDDGLAGEAYLVGAGPGSADLLTLRGRQLLAQADVVLYDRLASRETLAYARRDAELISVGKTPGRPSITQKQLNRLLVSLVAAGKRVCRLKGGDPMVFGRAAEEIEALLEAGLPFQIVPGVSAAEGCAAYAGIPLTMRGVAHAVLLTTGHMEHAALPDLSTLRPGQTLVFYMGVARYAEIGAALMAHGHPTTTPVAIVERGTTPEQRVVRACLNELEAAAAQFAIESPALLLVGETTRQAERYSWFAPHNVHHYRPPEDSNAIAAPPSRKAM